MNEDIDHQSRKHLLLTINESLVAQSAASTLLYLTDIYSTWSVADLVGYW